MTGDRQNHMKVGANTTDYLRDGRNVIRELTAEDRATSRTWANTENGLRRRIDILFKDGCRLAFDLGHRP